MNVGRGPVPFEAQYFREEGVHSVPSLENPEFVSDYIVSYPTWTETLEALKENIPAIEAGLAQVNTEKPKTYHMVTTDFSTIEDWSEVPHNPKLIQSRIRQAAKLTEGSNAVLHLGTPTYRNNLRTGESYWHNSVLSIQGGYTESAAHKTWLFPAERTALKMQSPDRDMRTVVAGSAAMICSELWAYDYDDSPLARAAPRQIVASTNFAVPLMPGESQRASVERAGGEDIYYRKSMESCVGDFVLKSLSSVERVIVSDRGRPDLAPYNAVFTRTA